jgi:uncharacterized delta-60 repeat protein
MRLGGALALLLLPVVAHGWTTLLNGTAPGSDGAVAVRTDAGGNVVAAGFTTNAGSDADFTVAKFAGATEVWRQNVRGTANISDQAIALALDAGGNAIAAGITINSGSDIDWTVVKLAAADGSVVWRRDFNGTVGQFEFPVAVAVDGAGDVLVAGALHNRPSGFDFVVLKLSGANGGELWRAQPAPSAVDSFNLALAVAVDADGNVTAAGNLDEAFTVVRFAKTTGAPMWAAPVKLAGTGPGGAAIALAIDGPTRDAVVAGSLEYTGSSSDFAVARLSGATGTEAWRVHIDGTAKMPDSGVAVALDGAGNVFAAGTVANTGSGDDIHVVKLKPNGGPGAILWSRTFDGTAHGDDVAGGLVVDAAGNPTVSGTLRNTGTGRDVLVARLNGANGATTGPGTWTRILNGSAGADDGASSSSFFGLGFGSLAQDAVGNAAVATTLVDAAAGDEFTALRFAFASGAELSRASIHGDGTGAFDGAISVATDADRNVLAAGLLSSGLKSNDFAVVKLARGAGQVLWRYTLPSGPTTRGVASGLAVGAGGEVYAAGWAPAGRSDTDFTVVQLTGDGTETWRRAIDGSAHGDDEANALAVAGDTIVAGGFTASTAGGTDGLVARLDTGGAALWQVPVTGNGNGDDEVQAVALTPAGDVIAAARVENAGTKDDWRVLKLARAGGAVLWQQLANGTANNDDDPAAVVVDPTTGDAVVAGRMSNTGTLTDFTVARFAAVNGKELWRRSLDGTSNGFDAADALAIDAAGNILAVGELDNTTTDRDFVVVKLAPGGQVRWTQTLNGAGNGADAATSVTLDTAGNPIVGGLLVTRGGTLLTAQALLVVKLAAATGVEIWRHTSGAGSFSSDAARAVGVDGIGNVVVAGSLSGHGSAGDLAVTRLGPDGADPACFATPEDPACTPCGRSCDDGDPCTDDVCRPNGRCAGAPVGGTAAVGCAFQRAFLGGPCAGEKVPRAIGKGFKRAGTLADRAVAQKKARKAKQLAARAARTLRKTLKLVTRAGRRKRKGISADCAASLRDLVTDAKSRLEAFKAAR